MYTIAIDTSRNLIEIALSGLMSVEEVETYMGDLRRSMLRHHIVSGYRLMLDVSGCTIQTQDMMLAMGRHMVNMPKAGAIAVVVGNMLSRMQVRRLFQQPYARIVSNDAAARAWVFDGIEPPAEAGSAAVARA